jgi:HNH endonuclease/NUMOD4 motif
MTQSTIDATEEWRPVVGWEHAYAVSNFGRVKSLPRFGSDGRKLPGKFLLLSDLEGRYPTVSLSWGKTYKRTVHSLVAAAFLGKTPEGMEVNHIDCNHSNNRADNLEYVTHRENHEHAIKMGAMDTFIAKRGKHPRKPELTEDQVREIRFLIGTVPYPELTRRFGIQKSHLVKIKYRRAWPNVW